MSKRKFVPVKAVTSSNPSAPRTLHCGVTGARAGDYLAGCREKTANVRLKVVTGEVRGAGCWAREMVDAVEQDGLAAMFAKHFGISNAAAELKIKDRPVWQDGPNHLPLGAGCAHKVEEECDCPETGRFVILCQGAWQEAAEEHGHGEEMQRLVDQQVPTSWREVLNLVRTKGVPKGHTLLTRISNYEVVSGPTEVAASDPRLMQGNVVDGRLAKTEAATSATFDIGGHLIKLPPSGPPFRKADASAALDRLFPDISLHPPRTRVFRRLRPLTGGALKSLVQKCVRCGAPHVDLGDQTPLVETELVASTALLLLFASSGTFSPELQLFTRGCTAALKRTAVILLEDSWPADPATAVAPNDAAGAVESLMAQALATQRMTEYHPPHDTVLATVDLLRAAVASRTVVAWRKQKQPQQKQPQQKQSVSVSAEAATSLQRAAVLMRVVRSFKGDMDMFDTVAAMPCGLAQCLATTQAVEWPDVMPLEHMVDQHAFRGVGHPMPSGTNFAQRFTRVFDECTGLNPRLGDVLDEAQVNDVRFAQWCCAQPALGCKYPPLALQDRPAHRLSCPLDSGVLAAGVGAVRVTVDRRELMVMLGVVNPADEIVMRPPTRDPKDLFKGISDRERTAAIALLRAHPQRVSSPLLPRGVATFVDHEWHFEDRPWRCWVAEGVEHQLPVVVPAPWVGCLRASEVFNNEIWIRHAFTIVGEGMVEGAREHVLMLVRGVSAAVGMRALAMLRNQWTVVAMPTPSLQGGLASDQLAATADDPLVWRLLVLLARLVPSALRPQQPPRFSVRNPLALRQLERWVSEALSSDSSPSRWPGRPEWQALNRSDARLMEHQRAAVQRMLQRDAEGEGNHFVVMDVGLGKTVTSLYYSYLWLCRSGRARRILWVTPKGTIDSLCQQLRDTWAVPVHLVPRVSTAKKPKVGETRRVELVDYQVNVIHADHLRTAVDAGLVEAAETSLIIFDEVDEMYNVSLRTSAAQRLAQLCPKFVAQTATPMRKHERELRMWLADTCAFPVDDILVAASSMVAVQLELSIKAEERLELVPMTDAVRGACRELLDRRQWLPMARVTQEATDPAMVDLALAMAAADRAVYPDGGVLLVADSLRHADQLIEAAARATPGFRVGGFASLSQIDALDYGVVVVTKQLDRGYNSASRLGAMVTGAYAGNAAARHQIRGRIRRIGQKRPQVQFVTVAMENSLLELLHHRHSRVDCMNLTLEQLGERFEGEVLDALSE